MIISLLSRIGQGRHGRPGGRGADPRLTKQQPADGTSYDDGEECGNISLDQRADQDLGRDSHQEREYRAKQNDSRDNRELPGGKAAHAVTAVNTDLGYL